METLPQAGQVVFSGICAGQQEVLWVAGGIAVMATIPAARRASAGEYAIALLMSDLEGVPILRLMWMGHPYGQGVRLSRSATAASLAGRL